ncbi:MAG: 3-deoxy-manno-octulosonate cytidylyltransferase [Candidatus Marinimicrobia bacterium]|nr:3-deoxy-manno-octulosonate cytidylyltransferase [Candidatus Neomarinimicrobiota bacterium]
MKVLAVIPARYESSRLPGKPLADLGGKTLIQRVYENVRKCKKIDQIIVATDDDRIRKEVEKFGGTVRMTDPQLPSGTDRAATVARDLDCEIVVNIQGDEPFLSPEVIDQAIDALIQNPEYKVSTVGKIGLSEEEIQSPNTVKVITNKKSEALYFSRFGIPYVRDKENNSWENPSMKHIGLYVFRKEYLMKFIEMEPGTLEKLEKLEQLRILENCEKIYIAKTHQDSFGIDTSEDLTKARRWLSHD